MAIQQPWADGPFPLVSTQEWASTNASEHATIHMALEMARAHNVLLRGLNAIYLQGGHVNDPQDISDYLFFCRAWCIMTHHHHKAEEKYLFPDLCALTGKDDLMEANLLQHKAFHDGIDAFETYVTKTSAADYRWETLKSMIDAFTPAFLAHLEQEIPTLLALREYDDKALRKIWDRTEKFAARMADSSQQSIVIPLALGCIDRTYEDGLHKNFPPLPFFVPALVDWWYARKYRGSWRFCPCEFYRNPRALAFGPGPGAAAR